jgi:hypothetical protein
MGFKAEFRDLPTTWAISVCSDTCYFLLFKLLKTETIIIIIIIIITIIIIIIILGISFMQGIYTYIPETNHVPREHCVATILM